MGKGRLVRQDRRHHAFYIDPQYLVSSTYSWHYWSSSSGQRAMGRWEAFSIDVISAELVIDLPFAVRSPCPLSRWQSGTGGYGRHIWSL